MVKKRRGTDKLPSQRNPSTFGSSLRISIATSPRTTRQSISFDEELRLLKPALLYADEVTLFSPAAVMMLWAVKMALLNESERMTFLKQVYSHLHPELAPLVLWILDAYKQLERPQRRRSRAELLAYLEMRPKMEELRLQVNQVWQEQLVPKVEEMMASSGADQLGAAIDADLLRVDPILVGEEEYDADRFIERFVDKLGETLRSHVYPLFDDEVGRLVKSGLAEGLFQTSPLSRERGKQVSAASAFMGRLPAFPAATISEILDIRSELHRPLVRFRSAMVELAKSIEAAAYDDEFGEQVDEVFRSRVEPALLEIEEAVEGNRYLRQLIGEAIGDTKTLLAGVLAFGAAQTANLPQLLVAGGAAAGQAIATATWEQHRRRDEISKRALYFLYRTEELLGND